MMLHIVNITPTNVQEIFAAIVRKKTLAMIAAFQFVPLVSKKTTITIPTFFVWNAEMMIESVVFNPYQD